MGRSRFPRGRDSKRPYFALQIRRSRQLRFHRFDLRHLPIDLNPRVQVAAKEIAHGYLGVRWEQSEPTDWDLSFDEYLEEHKNSKLLFCWYAPRVGIVFSPSDHNGIRAGRLEGVKGKGTLLAYVLNVVERIAKEKGLVLRIISK
jgi:hypothetical protein